MDLGKLQRHSLSFVLMQYLYTHMNCVRVCQGCQGCFFPVVLGKNQVHHFPRILASPSYKESHHPIHTPMEVFPHITQRHEPRICLRFDKATHYTPLLEIIRSHGSHRPVGDQQPHAWHFPPEAWEKLEATLSHAGFKSISEEIHNVHQSWLQSEHAEEDSQDLMLV